jgi:hypothetical protein
MINIIFKNNNDFNFNCWTFEHNLELVSYNDK